MNSVVSVIIPAYNEEDRIEETLLAIREVAYISKVYVVDDGSTDATAKKVKSIGGRNILISSPVNKGKGHALAMGLKDALSTSDIIVFLDADLRATAKEATKLIMPIYRGEADVTIGKLPAAKKKGGFGLVKALAKYGVYMHTGLKLDTTLSGQRAFKGAVLRDLKHQYHGYGIELGMTIDLIKMGYIIKEIDVNMLHNETGRDIAGFIHRGRQFCQILRVLMEKSFEKLN